MGEDLNELSEKLAPKVKRTLWLSSQYRIDELKARLREDPRNFSVVGKGICDIKVDGTNLHGNLVVGSVVELNKWLKKNPKVAADIRGGFGDGEVDLVSGGPPCQSFSMAGLRQLESDKNSLP